MSSMESWGVTLKLTGSCFLYLHYFASYITAYNMDAILRNRNLPLDGHTPPSYVGWRNRETSLYWRGMEEERDKWGKPHQGGLSSKPRGSDTDTPMIRSPCQEQLPLLTNHSVDYASRQTVNHRILGLFGPFAHRTNTRMLIIELRRLQHHHTD